MKEQTTNPSLLTLPSSLSAQFDRLAQLVEKDDEEAHKRNADIVRDRSIAMLELMREMVSKSPELATLLMAMEQGKKGFEIETSERVDRYQMVAHRILGVHITNDSMNLPTETRRKRVYRLI